MLFCCLRRETILLLHSLCRLRILRLEFDFSEVVMVKLRDSLLLFLAALIWGVTFVGQSDAMKYIEPFTFNFLRCVIGALVLLPFSIAGEHKRLKNVSETEKKAELKALFIGGLLCGLTLFAAVWSGFKCNTGYEMLDALLTRGGIMDFAGTIVMLLFAFSFAGVIKKMGMLKAIMKNVLKVVHSPGVLITITTVTDLLGVMIGGAANVSSLINGEVYKDAYKKMGLAPTNLARTLAMDGALFNAMLPWTASGALCFSSLGVLNFEYWPYMVTFWVALVMNIVFAFMGKFTQKIKTPEAEAVHAE